MILSGTIVGVVEKSRMLDGPRNVRVGDVVIGLASSGLHTNGYSLARKILFEQMKLKPQQPGSGVDGGTLGEELLKVHLSYGPVVQKLLQAIQREGERLRQRVRRASHVD